MNAWLTLALLVVACSAAPRTSDNAAWNVNQNPDPNAQPSDYYGNWPGHKYMPSPQDWRKIGVYQLLTDRFADGDPTNNEVKYGGYNLYYVNTRHGGDFRGIMKKMDYIQALGFNAIWISPVFQNQENSYHGYGMVDFTILDGRFGTVTDFRNMVDAAHQRGIYVIVDIVVNHMSNLLYFEGHPGDGAPFRFHSGEYRQFWRDERNKYTDFQIDNTWDANGYYGTVFRDNGYPVTDNGGGTFSFSDFHHNGDLGDYGDPWQDHLGKIYGALDDLRNDHPRVQAKLIAMIKSLIGTIDIDGIRMDTPMQVPQQFFAAYYTAIRDYARSLGKKDFFVFGEFFCSAERASTMTGRGKTPDMIGKDQFIDTRYAHDAGLFYPVYQWFNDAIKSQNPGVLANLYNMWKGWQTSFDWWHPNAQPNAEMRYQNLHFFNNHDQWRMSTSPDGFQKQALATGIINTFPGVPLFYYGDEQGFITQGTALDGYGREDMMTSLAWKNFPKPDGSPNPCLWDNFDMCNDKFLWTQKLNMIRKKYLTLQNCEQVYERWVQPQGNAGVYIFSRICGDPQYGVLVAFNTWKFDLQTSSFYTGWGQGQVMVNAIDPTESYTLGTDGAMQQGIHMNGYQTKIFVLQSNLQPIEPVVTSAQPYHDQYVGVSAPQQVVLTFSNPMDQGSGKGAFEFDGQAVAEGWYHWFGSQMVKIDLPSSVADGIHYMRIKPNMLRDQTGRFIPYAYFTRFRCGQDNNVIMNKDHTTDQNLVELTQRFDTYVQATLHHTASGAELFRVSNDGNTWSDWTKYTSTSQWQIPTSWSGTVQVQYWADSSAAYIVGCQVST